MTRREGASQGWRILYSGILKPRRLLIWADLECGSRTKTQGQAGSPALLSPFPFPQKKTIGDLGARDTMKYVVVVGGGVNGNGTDATALGVGVLLQACGLLVTAIKMDAYLREQEVCQYCDLFYCENFLEIKLSLDYKITMGKIYQLAIEKEAKRERALGHACSGASRLLADSSLFDLLF